MRTIVRLGVWCLTFFSIFSVSLAIGAEITVNPHGKKELCYYCHKSNLVEDGKPEFRLNTVKETCIECHKKRGATFKDYLRRMLPDVRDKEKLIVYFLEHPDFSCHSCHHVICQSDSREELKRRNPHVQLDSNAKPIKKRCLFCHTIFPDYLHPGSQETVMRYDLTYLCSACHVMMSQKGGLGLGKRMSEAMIRKKEEFEKEYDVSLPLGPNDIVVCASCHNPHEFGVVLGKRGNTTPSGEHRLVVEDPWRLCTACHLGQYSYGQ